MPGIATEVANDMLDWIRGNAMPSAPTGRYVALYDGDPGNDGLDSDAEDVTSTLRAAGRVSVTFGAPADKEMSNSAIVDFGIAESGASFSHFGVWSASVGGTFLGGGELTSPKTALAGDPVAFAVGTLTVNLKSAGE